MFAEFQYAPYSSKEEVDEIDTTQTLTKFTTKVEKLVYNEGNPSDFNDLHKNYKDKLNKAKARWTVDVSSVVYDNYSTTQFTR